LSWVQNRGVTDSEGSQKTGQSEDESPKRREAIIKLLRGTYFPRGKKPPDGERTTDGGEKGGGPRRQT